MSDHEFDSVCNNNGCKQKFSSKENGSSACVYHPGKPIFHDLKKGWACCGVIVYDWEEFQKIKGCAVGVHCLKVDQPNPETESSDFAKSHTVSRAESALANSSNVAATVPVKAKNIDDFNKEQEQQKEKQKEGLVEKKLFVLPNGNLKCVNRGCNKEFKECEAEETSCKFHVGMPVFHDGIKSWSCCKKETWDWDDFMKLPTCSTGRHIPKMV